jgi:hypothetical protein
MGAQLVASTFGENVQPKLLQGDAFPYGGKLVGLQEFYDLISRYGDKVYLGDPYAPEWYCRPGSADLITLWRAIDKFDPRCANTWRACLDWLLQNPNVWISVLI